MKNKKPLLALAAIALTSAFSLTSCGNTANNVDTTLPEDDPTSEVEIEFWHCLGHEKSSNLEKIVNDFNTKYAGKYKVKAVKLSGSYDSLASDINQKIAAAEIPALTMGYPDNFSVYMGQSLETSALLRLDNFINDKNYGYSEEEIKDFVPAFYDEGNDYQFSGQWSMPMYKSTEIMYYNVNYFYGANAANNSKFKNNAEYTAKYNAAKGATASDEQLKALKSWLQANNGYTYEVPTTWEEMVDTAKQMKADLATENIKDEFYPVGYDSDANLLISQFAMRDIPYTTNENISAPKDHILFNNDEAKSFVSSIVDLYNDKLFITRGILGGDKYTNEYFTTLKSAMSIGSTGGSSYNVSSNFRVGLAPVPYPEGKTPKYIQQGPSICFFNNDNAYIHKGAWLFYKALAETTNNAKLAMQNSYDPVRLSSFDTDEYKQWIAKKDLGLNYAIPAATASLRDKYMTSAVFLGSETARNEVGNILTYVIGQGMSVDNAFKTAYDNTVKATKATY